MRYLSKIYQLYQSFWCLLILSMSKFWPVFGHSSHVLFSKYIFCVSNQSSCYPIYKKYSLKNKYMVLNKIQRFLLCLSRLYILALIIFEIEVPREEDSIIINLHQSSLCSKSNWTLGYLISWRNIIFKILADIQYVLGTANTFETPLTWRHEYIIHDC